MPEPLASVVVPTRDRPRQLEDCLAALAGLRHERFEVVVGDDGIEPLPADLVSRWRARIPLRVVRTPGAAGAAAARNAAFAEARGAVVAFTDDDCRPRPDWLAALARGVEEWPRALVGGRTVNGRPGCARSSASQLVADLVDAHFNADPDDQRFFPTCNLAVRADTLRLLGGFDERFRTSEDRELCERWRRAGLPLRAAPAAVVEHHRELSVREFARQHLSYGRGAHALQRRLARGGGGTVVSDLGFHARLPRRARAALGGLPARRRAALLALLVVWQAAYAAGFAQAAGRALSRGESRERPPAGAEAARRPSRVRPPAGSAPARPARRR